MVHMADRADVAMRLVALEFGLGHGPVSVASVGWVSVMRQCRDHQR
jgi:hypothetical protein